MSESTPTPQRRRPLPGAELAAAAALLLMGCWVRLHIPAADTITTQGALGVLLDGVNGASFMIACGLMMGFAALKGIHAGARRERDFQELLMVVAIPAFLAAALALNRIGATKTGHLPGAGGLRYFWLDDDGMISMRYAWNLARGAGLVWNEGGPRVEGFTNFLWTLVMAVPHLLGMPERLTSLPILAVNTLFLGLIVVELARLGTALGLSPVTLFAAGICVAANRSLVYWTAGGSEAVPLAWAVLFCARRVVEARRGEPLGWGTGIAASLMALLRADGLILMAAFLPALFVLLWRGRARWSAVVAAALPVAALFIFRRIYYGDLFPNTYYLKAVDLPMKQVMGVHYVRDLIAAMGGACALAIAGFMRARNPLVRWLALVPATGIAYTIMVGGDELGELRFLAPILPLLTLGAAAGAERVFTRRGRSGGFGWVVLVMGLAHYPMLTLPGALTALGRNRGEAERSNTELGLLLKKNTREGAHIAHFWAGAAVYFSERPADDMLGKNDAHIAHLPGHAGQFPPGHTKYDAAYSLGLRPDVIVTAQGAQALDPEGRPGALAQDYPALYALYDEPTFQRDYAPGLVPLGLSLNFHAVFVRRDTALAAPPAEWKE